MSTGRLLKQFVVLPDFLCLFKFTQSIVSVFGSAADPFGSLFVIGRSILQYAVLRIVLCPSVCVQLPSGMLIAMWKIRKVHIC